MDKQTPEQALSTWPERIFLQGEEGPKPLEFPGISEDLPWCDSRTSGGDVEYVRADLAPRPADSAAPVSLTDEQIASEAKEQALEDATMQQADSWLAVCALLDELAPNWQSLANTGQQSALIAIRSLKHQEPAAGQQAPKEPT